MSHDEAFHFRVPGALKQRWAEACERKRINQTAAIIAVMEFCLSQDDVAQSMIFGQLDAADDVIEVVLKRLQRRGHR